MVSSKWIIHCQTNARTCNQWMVRWMHEQIIKNLSWFRLLSCRKFSIFRDNFVCSLIGGILALTDWYFICSCTLTRTVISVILLGSWVATSPAWVDAGLPMKPSGEVISVILLRSWVATGPAWVAVSLT